MIHRLAWALVGLLALAPPAFAAHAAAPERLRLIVETDAGGDPDDEQSLVRFLVYANEWDIEGIIANRPVARPGENKNPERTGLGIVRAMVRAYGECQPNLAKHDARFPRRSNCSRARLPVTMMWTTACSLCCARWIRRTRGQCGS